MSKRKRSPEVAAGDLLVVAGSYERVLSGVLLDDRDDRKKRSERENEANAGDSGLAAVARQAFMFTAHMGCIRCLDFAGRYLASGGADEIIRLYDMKKHKDLGSLVLHTGSVTQLTFVSKTYLMSAGEDGMLFIWRTKDWEVVRTLKGHKGRVNGFAVHPSGRIALSVGADRTLRLWNLLTGRKASKTRLLGEGVAVVWNTAGDQFAVLFGTNVCVYSMQLQIIAKIEHTQRLHCMRYAQMAGKEVLLVGSEDGTLLSFSENDKSTKSVIEGHRARIKSIDVYQDAEKGLLVATASSDGTVIVWALKDEQIEPIAEHAVPLRLTCVLIFRR